MKISRLKLVSTETGESGVNADNGRFKCKQYNRAEYQQTNIDNTHPAEYSY